MGKLNETVRGIQQFGRTENLQTGSVRPLRELVWLSKRAVQEDKKVVSSTPKHFLFDAKLYKQRLLEIGFIFTEIFVRDEYPWRPRTENPRVIDLGGDIGGFSVLHWKALAPNARITLVEANPSTASVVSESLARKGFNDVEVINAAVSDQEGEINLHLHKPGAGYHPSDFIGERANFDPTLYHTVTVPTVKLSDIMGDERVDLLKIDIEGAEGRVLRDLANSGKINMIDEIIMEFHNDPTNSTNSLTEVVQILTNAHFTIEGGRRSGRKRVRKNDPVDIYSVSPSDKMLFIIRSKREKNS